MSDSPIFPTHPLERVREGMQVVDEAGAPLGSVVRVYQGDPEAVTTAGNEPAEDVVVVPAPAAMDEQAFLTGAYPIWGELDPLGDVPEPLRLHLLRTGFVQLGGSEVKGAQRFIPGDDILDASGQTVTVRRQS